MTRSVVRSPQSKEELFDRASQLAGLSIGDLVHELGIVLPRDLHRNKGHIGCWIEQALGASAGNLDQPDFPHLGVELKTIPIDRMGRVRESTFICTIDLDQVLNEEWASSRAWRKLREVLWVPVESAKSAPLLQRRIGNPYLWKPTGGDESLLRSDWEMLIGNLAIGGIDEVSARDGEALQIRPKAANSRITTTARGPEMQAIPTVPRGFYLRARFTESVLWRLSGRAAQNPTSQSARNTQNVMPLSSDQRY